VLALALSAWLSRRYAIWDRQWHIPLTTSLRGQRIPFVNVYQPNLQLGYHVSGDVLAATLQVLSGARLHASLALSLAHDLVFMLTALSIAALLLRPERKRTSALFAAAAPLTVLLAGPPPSTEMFTGFSHFNYYQMSYRPHVVLAGLLICGITAWLLTTPLPSAGPPARPRLGALLTMLALLAVTDEPSAMLLVPALMLMVFLARKNWAGRRSWLAVAASAPGIIALAMVILPSTASGPRLPTALVAPALPSFLGAPRSLASANGIGTLLLDLAPMLVLLSVIGVTAARTRRREVATALVFAATVLSGGTALLTTLVVAGTPPESHRFMTLPQLVLPLTVLFLVASMRLLERVAAAAALLIAAGFSLAWAGLSEPTLEEHFRVDGYATGIHRVDCRAATGARLFEPARPTYVPRSDWYMWTGCHPVLAPGQSMGLGNRVDVGRPLFETPALVALAQHFLDPTQELTIACPADRVDDPICREALARPGCSQSGAHWRRCLLPAAERDALLARLPHPARSATTATAVTGSRAAPDR
jgi:hypothetical protein